MARRYIWRAEWRATTPQSGTASERTTMVRRRRCVERCRRDWRSGQARAPTRPERGVRMAM